MIVVVGPRSDGISAARGEMLEALLKDCHCIVIALSPASICSCAGLGSSYGGTKVHAIFFAEQTCCTGL
jgi:hypothetical protein